MVGLAVERHRVRSDVADDGVDDANRLSVALQNAALLNMQFNKGADIGSRSGPARGGKEGRNPHACASVDKACALGVTDMAYYLFRNSPGQKIFLLPQKRKRKRLPSSSAIVDATSTVRSGAP